MKENTNKKRATDLRLVVSDLRVQSANFGLARVQLALQRENALVGQLDHVDDVGVGGGELGRSAARRRGARGR